MNWHLDMDTVFYTGCIAIVVVLIISLALACLLSRGGSLDRTFDSWDAEDEALKNTLAAKEMQTDDIKRQLGIGPYATTHSCDDCETCPGCHIHDDEPLTPEEQYRMRLVASAIVGSTVINPIYPDVN